MLFNMLSYITADKNHSKRTSVFVNMRQRPGLRQHIRGPEQMALYCTPPEYTCIHACMHLFVHEEAKTFAYVNTIMTLKTDHTVSP